MCKKIQLFFSFVGIDIPVELDKGWYKNDGFYSVKLWDLQSIFYLATRQHFRKYYNENIDNKLHRQAIRLSVVFF